MTVRSMSMSLTRSCSASKSSQTGAVQHTRYQPRCTGQLIEAFLYFGDGEYDGEAAAACADE